MVSHPLVTAQAGPPAILYRDDALIVIDKPSGLAVHRGMSNDHGDYVLTRVRDLVGQHVYLAHRLDRATSGVIVLTTAPELVPPLQCAFNDGRVDKRYLALARGVLTESVSVDYAIPKSDAKDAPRVEARTDLRCVAVGEGRYSLVEARPITGRYHQIRRHLKHLQHPIVGDTTYGDGKQNRIFRERFGLFRLALHAAALSFPHPVTGARVVVTAPIPADISLVLSGLGLPTVVSFGHLEEQDDSRPTDSA